MIDTRGTAPPLYIILQFRKEKDRMREGRGKRRQKTAGEGEERGEGGRRGKR